MAVLSTFCRGMFDKIHTYIYSKYWRLKRVDLKSRIRFAALGSAARRNGTASWSF
jgi:hypothetical protein